MSCASGSSRKATQGSGVQERNAVEVRLDHHRHDQPHHGAAMTQAEKKERRLLKRALRAAVLKNHFSRDFKLCATNRQMIQAAKTIADQLLAGRNPNHIQVLE